MPDTLQTRLPHADIDHAGTAAAPGPSEIAHAVRAATRRIAPLWPLKHFVAVNPYLGLADQAFAAADATLGQVAGSRLTKPRAFYAEAIRQGRVTRRDLADALAQAGGDPALPGSADALAALAETEPADAAPLPTVAHAAADATGTDWPAIATDRISVWAAGYFDQGQSIWRSPWRDRAPYAAWQAQAEIDRMPEIAGARGFRAVAAALPADADAAIAAAVGRLGVPAAGLEAYFHRLLMTIGGWAAYARYLTWTRELAGGSDTSVAELLAVRLAWEVALLETQGAAAGRRWTAVRAAYGDPNAEADGRRGARAVDLALHAAYENAWQRTLLAGFAAGPATSARPTRRPAAQAAFCIDVRSEPFRRALERADPAVETIGFAGFFGVPIEVVALGHDHGGAHCPVLLTPAFAVRETVAGVDGHTARAAARRGARLRARKAWTAFKLAAVSAFGFVEAMGPVYLVKLITDTLGRTRPVPHPGHAGIAAADRARLGPTLAPAAAGGRTTGLPVEARIDTAEAVLKAMSMTRGLARLVLLAGHGSTTVNNPHATGLDCGACGGHTGEANARVAALILNDPEVRAALPARGIELPADTVFLAGLHDTTTDRVTLFDTDRVPASHAADLQHLRDRLAEAGRRNRAGRAPALGLPADARAERAVPARSRDWSQVRPEWGLAGCAAFVAAPRQRTAGIDLGGRAFLQSYDWRQDAGYSTLELIMTAPMVVASWISLQYYGSTVDNRRFGSGNKVLHNVTGALGVLEGQGGDLRPGLPWQALHDGTALVHEPLRLNVLIEAPAAAILDVIARHDGVRQLLDHGWLHLYRIAQDGRVTQRYTGGLTWTELAAAPAQAAA